MSACLFSCLSSYLCVCLYACVSVSLSVCRLCLCIWQPSCLCVCQLACPSNCSYACVSCLSTKFGWLPVCLEDPCITFCPSVCLSVSLSAYISACLTESDYLLVFQSACLFQTVWHYSRGGGHPCLINRFREYSENAHMHVCKCLESYRNKLFFIYNTGCFICHA